MNSAELTEEQIDQLRIAAFKSNAYDDRQAYFEAASKWFQARHYRAEGSANADGRKAALYGGAENRPASAGSSVQGSRDGEGVAAGSGAASDDAGHEHDSAANGRQLVRTPRFPAIHLVRLGDHVHVNVEIAGKWITVIKEFADAPFSHIVEPSGIEAAISKAEASS